MRQDFQKKQELYLQQIKEFTLLDDEFMTKVFEDETCVEFLLQILLDQEDLKVQEVHVQKVIKNLQGRSIRMDILASDDIGKIYNVEIQRSDKGAVPERARYHTSLLDANLTEAGEDYTALPETYVIFIVENDVLKSGLPIYHIDRTIQETGEAFYDKTHIIYVNAWIQDETDLGKLMHDFTCPDPADMYYEVLAERVRYFKEDTKGVAVMNSAMEKLWKEAMEEVRMEGRIEGRMEGRMEGRAEERVRSIAEILFNQGTKDDARRFLRATEEELQKAEEMLCVMQ